MPRGYAPGPQGLGEGDPKETYPITEAYALILPGGPLARGTPQTPKGRVIPRGPGGPGAEGLGVKEPGGQGGLG